MTCVWYVLWMLIDACSVCNTMQFWLKFGTTMKSQYTKNWTNQPKKSEETRKIFRQETKPKTKEKSITNIHLTLFISLKDEFMNFIRNEMKKTQNKKQIFVILSSSNRVTMVLVINLLLLRLNRIPFHCKVRAINGCKHRPGLTKKNEREKYVVIVFWSDVIANRKKRKPTSIRKWTTKKMKFASLFFIAWWCDRCRVLFSLLSNQKLNFDCVLTCIFYFSVLSWGPPSVCQEYTDFEDCIPSSFLVQLFPRNCSRILAHNFMLVIRSFFSIPWPQTEIMCRALPMLVLAIWCNTMSRAF